MSENDTSAEFNDLTEQFHRETGIWPPGRDRPSAYGCEDISDLRMRAWDYWRKSRREQAQILDVLERLNNCTLLCPKPICTCTAKADARAVLDAQSPLTPPTAPPPEPARGRQAPRSR